MGYVLKLMVHLEILTVVIAVARTLARGVGLGLLIFEGIANRTAAKLCHKVSSDILDHLVTNLQLQLSAISRLLDGDTCRTWNLVLVPQLDGFPGPVLNFHKVRVPRSRVHQPCII